MLQIVLKLDCQPVEIVDDYRLGVQHVKRYHSMANINVNKRHPVNFVLALTVFDIYIYIYIYIYINVYPEHLGQDHEGEKRDLHHSIANVRVYIGIFPEF